MPDIEKSIAIFEGYKIRRQYDEEKEVWYFSVIDILHVLLQNKDYQTSRKYWNKLKERLKQEGSQSVTNCHQLKMTAKKARLDLESTTGKNIITGENFLPPEKQNKQIKD